MYVGNYAYHLAGNYTQHQEGILLTCITLQSSGLIAFLFLPAKSKSMQLTKAATFFWMKLWMEFPALGLSLYGIGGSRKKIGGISNFDSQKAGKNSAVLPPGSFGAFSVRPASSAMKKILTFCTDQNLVFKFQGSWSGYSELNALKAVWSRKFTPKNAK